MRTILLGLLLTLLAACGAAEPTSGPPTASPATPIPATATSAGSAAAGPLGTWRLTTLAGQPVLGTTPLTLVLDASGQASGNGGCNQFSSTATLSEATITFTPIISTKMACADNSLNSQETAYLTALQSAAAWKLDGASLTLSDAQNTALAVFTRQ
jgi:heat shock protein HslJ